MAQAKITERLTDNKPFISVLPDLTSILRFYFLVQRSGNEAFTDLRTLRYKLIFLDPETRIKLFYYGFKLNQETVRTVIRSSH